MWMLDTDTCSYILRRRPGTVALRFKRANPGTIGISSVVLAELYYGANLHPNRAALRKDIREFASGLALVSWDGEAADHYGDIRAELERIGKPIGAMDMMIAAHARSRNEVLVTNNTKHFLRVPRLKVENWMLE